MAGTALPIVLIALLGITGCGGGGSSSAPPGYELSGTIQAEALHRVDSDTNDPETTPRDNNSPASAQSLPVPAIIGGFVAAPGTQTRFGPAGDEWDFYEVDLEAGEQALLHFPSSDAINLDLHLLDASENTVDISRGSGYSERVVAPEDGRYFVGVEAERGAAGYQLRLDGPWQTPSATAMASAAPRASEAFEPGEIIVRTRADIPDTTMAAQAGLQARAGAADREQLWRIPDGQAELAISALGGPPRSGRGPARGWADQQTEARDETLRVIQELRRHPDIVSAVPNYHVTSLKLPDDPEQPQQWFHDTIGLPDAWDITTGETAGDDVIVAVIDTGLQRDHEDMDPDRLLPGRTFLQNGDPDEIDPHGTHVTGIIGAATDNATGVAGISWHAQLMPIRTLDEDGRGTVYDLLQGVRYAAGLDNDSGELPDRPADVINLSLGYGEGGRSADHAELFREIRDRGILTVAAAGNAAAGKTGTETIHLPADYADVLAVGATDRDDRRAFYSNYGTGLDLVAPGGVMSTGHEEDGILSTLAPDSYGYLQGTSMATAVMSGTLALGQAVNPDLTLPGIRYLLEAGELTRDLGPEGWEPDTGWGRIDAFSAVQAFDGFDADNLPPRLAAQPTGLGFGYTQSVQELQLRNSGSGALAIEDIDVAAEWLQIEPRRVDDDGLGVYEVRASRGRLDSGRHTARIEVTADNGDLLEIPVEAQVAERDPERDTVGRVVVELHDADDGVVARTTADREDGAYHYRFDAVPEGEYRVVATTRMTGSETACSETEACGAWPDILDPAELALDRDRRDVDFRIAWPPEITP